MKNVRKITVKMLIGILPIIIIAMLLLSVISAKTSTSIIKEQVEGRMNSELAVNRNSITHSLDLMEKTAMNFSHTVGTSYETEDIDTYVEQLKKIVGENNLILGSGIWFEPNVFNKDEKYMGPYVYREGEEMVLTYDYSNADYDYFSQDFYKIVANGTKQAAITEPFYDKNLDMTMVSCVAPIYNSYNDFIGVVSIDIELTSVQQLVDSIQVGESGYALLLASDGTYLSSKDKEKVKSTKKMQEESDSSVAKAGKDILENKKGIVTTKQDGGSHLYYDTIGEINWKLIISIPDSQLNKETGELIVLMIIVCAVAIVLCVIVVTLMVGSMSGEVNRVKKFATSLAEGDFTINELNVKNKDELGQMSASLNHMYQNNKTVIRNIAGHAQKMNEFSEMLNSSTVNLMEQFANIEKNMTLVNESMMSSSAAAEEVNASVEEVNSSVNILTSETTRSRNKADEIRSRASEIGKNSKKAYQNATGLAVKYEEQLNTAVENAKVVENIGMMAGVISEIAEQINLLSLNASIEAARAGEQGRGFAVVASEIGKLAGDTAQTVESIQSIIQEVQTAFDIMSDGAISILGFIKDTVTPDYNQFVSVATKYGEDAKEIEEISSKIAEMTENIEQIMSEVSSAIQNVAESSQNTAASGNEVMIAVESVSTIADEVSNMSGNQQAIAGELNQLVDQFRL